MVSKEMLQFYFKLLYQESGLLLDESKTYLIESRLEPLAVQEGFDSIEMLGHQLMQTGNRSLREKVVDAMTTNETSFFRDSPAYSVLREVLIPGLLASNSASRKLRIWSAACSTGQEPYSLAILLSEMGSMLDGWDIQIMASDISESVLIRAKTGVYSQHEVQRGLTAHQLLRHFTQVGLTWQIKPKLQELVHFRRLNLLSPFSSIGQMDIVFCRNILIYLDTKTKQNVIDRITNLLAPEGVLFLGGTEGLFGLNTSLVRVDEKKAGFYKIKNSFYPDKQGDVPDIKRRRVCQT